MRELWRPGVPQLKLRVFQFDALLRGYLPKLHAHFQSIGLAPDVLVSQWFLTLFSYALPFHALARAWDVVFTEGWKMLFRLGLARLSSIAHQLLPVPRGDLQVPPLRPPHGWRRRLVGGGEGR